jgi:hypothetical protein
MNLTNTATDFNGGSMKVLTGEFIEFGDLLIGRDEYPIALVKEPFEIVEMTEDQLHDDQGSWVTPEYRGEIYIVKPFTFKDTK